MPYAKRFLQLNRIKPRACARGFSMRIFKAQAAYNEIVPMHSGINNSLSHIYDLPRFAKHLEVFCAILCLRSSSVDF